MKRYDEIVIGWSMEAALYSFRKGVPLFVVSDNKENIRDWLKEPIDYFPLRLEPEPKVLETNFGKLKMERHKREVTAALHWIIATLFGNLYKGSIQIDRDKLYFAGRSGYKQEFEADKIVVFNIENVPNLTVEIEDVKYEVTDVVKANATTEYDLVFSGYKKYCQEIWFCGLVSGYSWPLKDVCVVSIFDNWGEVQDPENSAHLITLMAEGILSDLEIEHSVFKHLEREVHRKQKWSAKDYDNFEFVPEPNLEEIDKIILSDKTKEIIRWFGEWSIHT